MQGQQQLPRPHSPSDNAFNNVHHKSSLHNTDAIFIPNSQNMYNPVHLSSDYPSDDGQKQQAAKVNGFMTAQYRNSSSFTVFPGSSRPRQHSSNVLGGAPFRDASANFSHPYPTATDVFQSTSLSHITSPTQPQLQSNTAHPFESIHHSRVFDYSNNVQQSNGDPNAHRKPSFGLVDYGTGPSSALLPSHQVGSGGKPGASQQHFLPPIQQHSGYSHTASQPPFANGVHVQSQTPYGPHLQTGGSTSNNGAGASTVASMNQLNAATPINPSLEEISTIFVVGFPEDMQVYITNIIYAIIGF